MSMRVCGLHQLHQLRQQFKQKRTGALMNGDVKGVNCQDLSTGVLTLFFCNANKLHFVLHKGKVFIFLG